MSLANSANPTEVAPPTQLGANIFAYDAAGRQVTNNYESGWTQQNDGASADASYARTYDAENHQITAPFGSTCLIGAGASCPFTSATLSWGGDGHVRSIVDKFAPPAYNSGTANQQFWEHWDGDTLLMDTHAGGSTLYVGKYAMLSQSGQWDVSDRDQTGTQQTDHYGNLTLGSGYSRWSMSGRQVYLKKYGNVGITLGGADCPGDQQTPGQCQTFSPNLSMTRSDGYSLGNISIQGVRTYDDTSTQWTTPDAYAGDVRDPISQKPFMWNDNNPFEYTDPSGYDPRTAPTPAPQPGPGPKAPQKEIGGMDVFVSVSYSESAGPISVGVGITVTSAPAVFLNGVGSFGASLPVNVQVGVGVIEAKPHNTTSAVARDVSTGAAAGAILGLGTSHNSSGNANELIVTTPQAGLTTSYGIQIAGGEGHNSNKPAKKSTSKPQQ